MKSYRLRRWSVPFAIFALAACSGDDSDPTDTDLADTDTEVLGDTEEDAFDSGEDTLEDDVDTGDDADAPEDTDAPEDADAPQDTDVVEDANVGEDTAQWPDPLSVDFHWPIFEAPSDSLAGTGLESCATYQAERCDDSGSQLRCEIYDVEAAAFNETPDEMLERAYLYDRWYELYLAPDGQTAERVFTHPMPPGTPESEWGDPANYLRWSGLGDSAIWTGTALNAYILRYLHTGTEADYLRMEEKTRVMLNFFAVTGIPGYISRYHYLRVPEGAPLSADHALQYDGAGDDNRPIENVAELDFLPEIYTTGYDDAEGTHWDGIPQWSGDPSIDQMNGPMVAFPMVYGLLRDQDLKDRITYEMTCYLHNLRRIEIRNLQQNPAALEAFRGYFSGDNLNLDPDDIDFAGLDTIVFYVQAQINTSNEDTYDRSCREFIQMEPWRVLDATDPGFVIDVLTLVQDVDRGENRRQQINHFYIPSIRGGDAMHMMHLTLMAHAFTGDERYLDFLRDELLGNIRTAEVAATMSALIMPRFCRRFYGTNIAAGPLWAFNNLLADSELDTHMQEVMHEEMWQKECFDIGNVNFNLMFASAVSEEIGGEDRAGALAWAVDELERFGGNGGIINDPRRLYYRSYDEVVSLMPDGIEPICATEEERAFCEREIVLFGASIPGEEITYACDGRDGECVMDDGLCTTAQASDPLPSDIRLCTKYAWQRSPFDIGDPGTGIQQTPGTDYSEQYWMARSFSFIEGNRDVLVWRDTGAACGE